MPWKGYTLTSACLVDCIVLSIYSHVDQLQRRGTESAGWQANPGPSLRPGAACCAVYVSRALMSQVLPLINKDMLLLLTPLHTFPASTRVNCCLVSIHRGLIHGGLLPLTTRNADHVSSQTCCYL